ncbi:MAG: zinc-binding dehydrogenase [Deltaproteobacteria bacterium]|jgi:threonine dehydrogenase-like Zn-dependent dehydrogenase|nr:zinc-binding dehydrogenase [Deltaproteobacteria bacterium]MBW2495659.1 zinc-binding dehydrogenase [Deltaproteobacteria bacterium]
MRRAQIHGPGDVRLDEVPEPEVGPGDALLAVGACGICGSDVGYVRLGGLAGPVEEPMPLGHELAGTVIAVGSEVRDLPIGARVALNPTVAGYAIGNGGPEGGFAPQLLVRDAGLGRNLFEIPNEMPFDVAALAEPLGVGMNAVDRVSVQPGDKVAVLGAGPIGLAALATLLDRGIEDVIVVDRSSKRLEVARKLGAPATLNAAEEELWEGIAERHGRVSFYGMPLVGTEVFIEATGARPLLEQLIDKARPGARISIVALHRETVPISFMTVMMKQLTLQGAMEYPERFENMIELLTRRDLTPMITHRFSLDDFLEAFSLARSPEAGAKIMIEIA